MIEKLFTEWFTNFCPNRHHPWHTEDHRKCFTCIAVMNFLTLILQRSR